MTFMKSTLPANWKYLVVNFEGKRVRFNLDRFEEMTCFFKKDLVPNIPL